MLREATYKGTSLHALQSNFCISTGTSDVSVERGVEDRGRWPRCAQFFGRTHLRFFFHESYSNLMIQFDCIFRAKPKGSAIIVHKHAIHTATRSLNCMTEVL